ncbi:MAG: glycosyltransferase family 4 protein [Candidatus Limnocylindria bacterium]
MARICVIVAWYFPRDARVSREVRALVAAGHVVDVICVPRPGEPRVERDGQVSIYRLPIARRRGGVFRYFFEFVTFQLAATLLAGALHLRHRYDLIQVASLPDWLVFAAVVPRLLGARVLLDLHECMPEWGATKYKLPLRHPVVRLLSWLEQASIRFANYVITCTQPMRQRFIERGATAEKIDVVLNSFDEEQFEPRRYLRAKRESDEFVLVSHGTIEENYGLDIIVRAVALLKERIPSLRLRLYGSGTHRKSVVALAEELGLNDRVWFSPGWVPIDELLPALGEADVGVIAVRRDAFRDLTHCIKMYDFITLRKPLIISRTRAVTEAFGDECFQIFESGDERDLARAIYEVYADPALRERLVTRATERNEPYRWVHQRRRYVEIVDRLVSEHAAKPSGHLIAEGNEDR